MAGSSYGTVFRITTWGESHGEGVGVVIDGCPAGLPLSEKDIQKYLDRRKPGQSRFTTPRKESDTVKIQSGVFEGQTLGTPVSLFVPNTNQHSGDYADLAECYRPGHADFPFDRKYGIRDYRGGGRSSGRETIGRVAGGAVAAKILAKLGISFLTYTRAIGPIRISEEEINEKEIWKNDLYMPNRKAAEKASAYLEECMKRKDSAGGIIECRISGVPVGIGETVFEKMDASLAKAILSIGAVRGFEIGEGFHAAEMNGSENNDPFYTDESGRIRKKTNHSGGTLGGMSDGSDIIFRAAVKPTPSIGIPQETVRKDGSPIRLTIGGRHDPVIVPRAVVVVESMAAITVLDLMLLNMTSSMDNLIKIYNNLP